MNSVHIDGVIIILKANENIKETILKEAMNIAHSEGLSKISMRKIANRCDIALGTIYNYYPTKADIVLDLVEGFWMTCFKDFNKLCSEELDFFEQIEQIYFHILSYLKRFEGHCLEYLNGLPSINKDEGKKREAEFMNKIVDVFSKLYLTHKSEFNTDVIEKFNEVDIARFILDNVIAMLKRFEEDYSLFDLTLKKLLI